MSATQNFAAPRIRAIPFASHEGAGATAIHDDAAALLAGHADSPLGR